MTAYYNEIDPYCANWLRNLMAADLIADGDIDTRSIEDVTPNDIKHYTQCHFFAGIGIWSLALRNAGWTDDRPVWTGSCPCQPFSAAGKGKGTTDERHLWPAFYYLISQCRPSVIFGEQVASKDALAWFDTVQTDLENADYASAAIDLCAAGFGAPHIRQRLYWVANSDSQQYKRCLPKSGKSDSQTIGRQTIKLAGYSMPCWLANTNHPQPQGRLSGRTNEKREIKHGYAGCDSTISNTTPTNGFWEVADWLLCKDGKWRAVRPGSFPLANGVTRRMGRLRAYGNAIVEPVAREFIKSFMECMP